jgi:signal transduction histidine kinase
MQVMANLLSNAAKFSPENVDVTVSAAIAGDRVRISVTECGRGVPPEFRDRIFGKFAQADASNARRQGGTGLGLSICKAIIEKLGGTIGFDSEPGRGATFWFELRST